MPRYPETPAGPDREWLVSGRCDIVGSDVYRNHVPQKGTLSKISPEERLGRWDVSSGGLSVGAGTAQNRGHSSRVTDHKYRGSAMKIRILLADDRKIVRDRLRALIDSYPDMEVVAEAADGRSAVRLAKEISPDIVIMDISMPDLNGIEATKQINADSPGVKILALSMHSDRRYIRQLFVLGAAGYLLKDCAIDELVNVIHAVAERQLYLSPHITRAVLGEYLGKKQAADHSVFSLLTAREREVLQLMAEGKCTKEIAYILNLSVKTIEAHRQNIMEKSNIHSVAELTKYAIMRERARMMGAVMALQSRIGGGTRIRLSIPLEGTRHENGQVPPGAGR